MKGYKISMNTEHWQILVVEDEDDSREMVQGILEFYGIASIGTATAEQALEVVQNTIPTMIIIDLALPGMDGWRLLNELRTYQHLQNVPCVAVTAYHSVTLAHEAIEAGFNAYFSKPIDATIFVDELKRIIGEFN
jgi:CheY-like chemotaxis protein